MKNLKKLFLIFILLLFSFCTAETLKAGISEEYVPNGFYGSWGVISKLSECNNYKLFNSESKDVWTLSGYSNVLYLQNLESGAQSQIILKEKSKNNALNFQREKVVNKPNNQKIIYKEAVKFVLYDNVFKGNDDFVVEEWQNNKLIKKSSAKYKILGTKISGTNPN